MTRGQADLEELLKPSKVWNEGLQEQERMRKIAPKWPKMARKWEMASKRPGWTKMPRNADTWGKNAENGTKNHPQHTRLKKRQ